MHWTQGWAISTFMSQRPRCPRESAQRRSQRSHRTTTCVGDPHDPNHTAGTVELNGYDRDLNRVRCEAIVRRVEELFPGAGHLDQAQFWTGLRPATPSNVPIIGRSKVRNLFLNTGHGTLGWTHACGSGKSVARIVSGLQPEVDFAFAGMPRGSGVAPVWASVTR